MKTGLIYRYVRLCLKLFRRGEWRNYTDVYVDLDREEFMRKWREAFKNTIFVAPLKPPGT